MRNRPMLRLGRPLLSALLLGCGLSWSLSLGCGDFSGDGALADINAGARKPGGPGDAPTGQRWEAVETDEGCGRSGIRYVLVDEVCGMSGEGYETPSLQAPMFRDGALFGQTLLAVDATFLWALDLSAQAEGIRRVALVDGIGEPVAAAAHGSTELLLAAGAEGLVRVDATSPSAPTRTGRVALPGFAYDVHVEGDTAYVALGKAGIGVVDLSSGELTKTIPVPGHAVGLKTKGEHAYVAACTSLAVVDLTAGNVIAQTWPDASVTTAKGVLTMPAKDVEIVGDVAFVAAGRGGAVAIDIATPEAPAVVGNCTRPEPSFYASGVRAESEKLFVAGGEWGVLPIDVSTAATACTSDMSSGSTPTPPPGATADCSAEAPWELLPVEELWAPPPPAKDPIQVLPAGDRVFAFGDARRIGTRAVDVRNTLSMDLPLVARYDEPRRVVGLAASGSRVIAAGSAGGLFTIGSGGELTRTATDREALIRAATAVGFTGDGRWIAAANGAVYAEGFDEAIATPQQPVHQITPVGASSVAIASATKVEILDLVTGKRTTPPIPVAHLPVSIAPDGTGGLYVAAPEWTKGVRIRDGKPAQSLAHHGIFGEEDAHDVSLWRTRLPRRHLVGGPELVELASLGERAGIVVHGPSGTKKIALPAATYAAAARDDSRVLAVTLDRSTYRSTLVTVTLAGGTPTVAQTEVWSGAASGIGVTQQHAYIADADGAIRVYDLTGAMPSLASVFSLEGAP